MKKTMAVLAAAMFAVLALMMPMQAGLAAGKEPVTSLAQLNDPSRTIGVGTGTICELSVAKELPQAKMANYTEALLGYEDVANGKIDAFVYDAIHMERALENGFAGVRMLEESLQEKIRVGVGISPKSAIPDLQNKINQFIAEIRADGTLQDMYSRWVEKKEETMPDIPKVENPQYRLRVGTTGVVFPFSYYKGKDLWGYDIELARRFAAWLNAELSLTVYDYGAIPPALASGEVDCVMADLQKSPAREETFPFSDNLFEMKQAVLVRDVSGGNSAAESGGLDIPLSTFSGKKVGVQTGTNFDDLVLKKVPDAQIEYYNTKADLAQALTDGKVEAIAMDSPVLMSMRKTWPSLTELKESLDSFQFGFVFPMTEEGGRLRDEFNTFLAGIKTEGQLWKMALKWTEDSDSAAEDLPDYSTLPATKGTLRLAVESGYEPFVFVKNNRVVGYEIELAALFCKESGYALEVVDMNFDAILPSISAGKSEFGAGGISMTPERMESVYFSDSTFDNYARMAVMKEEPKAALSFWESIKSSFEKTFLRENRWELFLRGIITTMIITVCSALLGTALGFLVYMLCRKGNPVANWLTSFMTGLIQGMPLVVLLMILYYLIFAGINISGTIVSVIAFSLTFGSGVYGMLRTGVGAVDRGQYEAAQALGYSDRRTFFKIILPQALPHIMPSYRGEIVGLIKATAVVGYIAVQDLTKMSDIVRSRTYEAFFPLIAITIIYFLLEGLLAFAVGKIPVNAKRRAGKTILKGVKTDDHH